jgi:alpha-tubulin suppressor-like RCC1 family protein
MSRVRSLCGLLSVAVAATCSDGTGPAGVLTVTHVTPYNGPLTGGTAVTITGTNFPDIIDSVRIGTGRLGSLARVIDSVWGLTWVSTTELTGTTPPSGTAGAVDVTVYTPWAGNATCGGCFTYKTPATWISLAVGEWHSCGLTSGGMPSCWGRNFDGQLGHGIFGYMSVTTPAGVVDGVAFANLTAGSDHACGLTSGGAAYCWGLNAAGQLGLGDTISRATPVSVAGGLSFASVTAGYGHTCGLTSGGTAYCWGANDNGQLGLGDTLGRATPAAVAGGLTFTSLTAGFGHTCGLASGGVAYCWGSNSNSQLGDATTPVYSPDGRCLTDRSTPVAVEGGLTFASLTASFGTTYGLTSAGVAYNWGYILGANTDSPTPVAVAGGIAFASLTAHGGHTCGLTGAGAAYCWGFNNHGQLGDGSHTSRATPVRVASP